MFCVPSFFLGPLGSFVVWGLPPVILVEQEFIILPFLAMPPSSPEEGRTEGTADHTSKACPLDVLGRAVSVPVPPQSESPLRSSAALSRPSPTR